jgi:DNA-binding NarL/FixJ family response regulator
MLEVHETLRARVQKRSRKTADAGVTTLVLVDLLGVEDFVVLTRKLGGSSFKVPTRVTANLLEKLTYSLAAKLVAHFGGLRFDVPKGRLLRGVQTRLAVLKAFEQGLGAAEIARSLNLTRRYVNMIISAHRAEKAGAPAKQAAKSVYKQIPIFSRKAA